MSAIQTYFQDFLTNIRLPDSLKKALISAHTELREQLKSDDLTKDLLVESFLQGSYAIPFTPPLLAVIRGRSS